MANRAVPSWINNRQKKALGTLSKFLATAWFRTAVIDAGRGISALPKGILQTIIATLVPSKRTTRKELPNVAPIS
jgi:hypothetical protein